MVKKFLNKTFGIRDGEIYISFLMQIYIFLVITVLLIIKPIVNAQFLSQLGASQLPYGYILIAITAVITTYFYNSWAKRLSQLRVTTISIIIFSLSFIGLGLIIQQGLLKPWVLYVYYIGVSLFAVITTSQFWVLANLVFNTREAKRLFGFIGAGAIAGGVFGGYLTSVVVSAFGNVTAIMIAAFLLLCCIPLLNKIWRLRIKKLNSYTRNLRKSEPSSNNVSAFKIVFSSKHLTYLALITGLGVIVAKLVDFQFSDFASRAILDTDKLASFFGFWFSTFNVLALSIQLFLTNRVLSRLGVATTLLILPLGIAAGSLLFLTFPELWVLVIIKGIDGSFKQSINKAAVELSIMPIPFNIKNQAKSFIDVAVDSLATGLAGLMLIFLVRRLNLDITYITIIILLLTFIWIVLIYKLREAYFNSFRINIQKNLIKEDIADKPAKKENTISFSRRILKSNDETEILAILNRLSPYKISALKNEIITLLNHPSDSVKIETIRQIYNYDKGTAIDQVSKLVDSENDELVYAALGYILEHTYINQNDFFRRYLDHEDPKIASAALLCLAEEIADNDKLGKQFDLDNRITEQLGLLDLQDGTTRQEDVAKLLLTIAHSKNKKFYPYITVNLENNNEYIVKHAIKAAGVTLDEQFQPPLLRFLQEKKYRKSAIKALKNYGKSILDTIVKIEKREELPNDIKKYIPKLIRSFNAQQSVKILTRFLKSKDIVIRFEASKALIKLKSKNESLYLNKRRLKKEIIRECRYGKVTLDALASLREVMDNENSEDNTEDKKTEVNIARTSIIEILEEQLQVSLQCIFKLLSLLYDEADINVTYSGLISDVKEARINALEFLDNLLQSQIKNQVLPLIEYYSIDDKRQAEANDLQINIQPETKILNKLAKNRGKRLKLEIIYLIELLKNRAHRKTITYLAKQRNIEVRQKAISVLMDLDKSA